MSRELMQVECYKLKLKPNSIARAREWAARMNSGKAELGELLKKEGMVLESVFLEESSEGDYLIYYLRSMDLKKAFEISQASQHPIDIFHRNAMKDIVASRVSLECLLDAGSGA